MAYSFSQLQTYMQCPLKYRYRYIDKITTEEYAESADVIVGQIVHSCLEKLYKDINTMKTPSKQELLEYYKKLWEDKEKEIKEQGGNIKDIIDNDEYTISDYKARGEKYLTNYYDKHSPFKDIKVIDAEFNFAFEICENIKFQGRIDRLDKINDTFIINDYKTNKRLPIEDKENYIEQLTLYGIGIRQKYGKYFNVLKARLYFLHFDIEDEREITQKKCNEVLDKYTTIIKEIESKKATYELGNKSIFEAKESSLCKFCDYQSICPLFTYINTDDEVISELSPKTIKNLVDKFVEVKNKISELSKQEESLKNIFLQYIQKKDPKGEMTKYLLQ